MFQTITKMYILIYKKQYKIFIQGIFSSVLTIVLVLMFYLVGEAAFRTILLILSFVFFITLFLACFMRRPSAIVFTNNNSRQNYQNQNPNSLNPKTYLVDQNLNHYNSSQAPSQKPVFYIVPNEATQGSYLTNETVGSVIPVTSGSIAGFCPVHHHPGGSINGNVTTPPPPELPPKTPVPTPPPIQTIPSRIPTIVVPTIPHSSHSTIPSVTSTSTSNLSQKSNEPLSPKDEKPELVWDYDVV